MTWFWLKLLDLLKAVYTWQGVDFKQLRAIVAIKLVMDNRRPFGLHGQRQKESSSSVYSTMLFGGLIGLVMGLLITTVPSVIISFTAYHSLLIVMITLMLISDFSSVLLDTSDNTIILPRPISSKTFYASRTTHILVYIGQIALSISIIPIASTFYSLGTLVGLALIATTALSVTLAVALTNGLYLLIMRFTSEERLKSIINYFQIIMTLLVMGGYQVLPRLLTISSISKTMDNFHWWALLIPPMWMTGLIKLANEFSFGGMEILLALFAIVVPILIWKLTFTYLTPYFSTKLSDLGTGSAIAAVQKISSETKRKKVFNIKEWVTSPGLERASYGLVWSALTHDRKLKLRVYPALGSIIVLIIIFLLQSTKNNESFRELLNSLDHTQSHLFAIYASIFLLITVAYEVQFTDEFKAAWIYLSAPVKRPGMILSGSMKAVLVKFFLPIYTVTSLVILVIWGSKAIVDLTFGALACLLLMVSIAVITEMRLPLSAAPTSRNQTASFARAIISMLIIGALGIGHYLLSRFTLLLWMGCPIMVLSFYFVWKIYSNAEWEDVEI